MHPKNVALVSTDLANALRKKTRKKCSPHVSIVIATNYRECVRDCELQWAVYNATEAIEPYIVKNIYHTMNK